MLKAYDALDYDLLLKRARTRQCLMRYEDAVIDANLAQNIQPQRLDAYQVLSDLLVAMNEPRQAIKMLEVLSNHDGSARMQYEQIKQKLAE